MATAPAMTERQALALAFLALQNLDQEQGMVEKEARAAMGVIHEMLEERRGVDRREREPLQRCPLGDFWAPDLVKGSR